MREVTRGIRATFLPLPTATRREDRVESWGCTMKGQEAKVEIKQELFFLFFEKQQILGCCQFCTEIYFGDLSPDSCSGEFFDHSLLMNTLF